MSVLNLPRVLFVVSFLVLWLAAWIGAVIRSRRQPSPETMSSDYSVVIGATLTLLGLLIGFTFSMATSRYDLRKSLEEEEANAIGTEYARVDFLPAADAARLQGLLRQYTGLRIRFYTSNYEPDLQEINAETTRMQSQLWSIVAGAAKSQPTPLSALASSGMNDVLNARGYAQAAWWNRIPVAAWSLMSLIAVLCNLLLGYGRQSKAIVLSVVLPLAVSISFFLIADIDSPRGGVIRVRPQNLYAVAESLKAQKHRVDYRHIIDWLVRKPGALEHYRYRDELFPTSRFRMAFDLLEEQLGRYQGSKEYLRILELAAKDSEVRVDAALLVLLGQGEEPISAAGIEAMLIAEQNTSVRDVEVAVVDLRIFDQLFSAQEVLQ